MTAAALIKRVRSDAGLTQVALAQRLGMSQATIAGLERPGANPTLATLSEVMAAVGQRLELNAVPLNSSVDETLVARNLRLTPAERLAAFEVGHAEVQELRRLMRSAQDGR